MIVLRLLAIAAVISIAASCSKEVTAPSTPGPIREPATVACLPVILKVEGMQRGEGGMT
ncbi:MAG: hypothetical protein HYY93_15380 [Planctomycetes bacterium]|nr:hypothetical protein [Planctomycetota bacterium]